MTPPSPQLPVADIISKCVAEALYQVCGGEYSTPEQRKQLLEWARGSIVFPNSDADSPGGKPHDVEVRIALSLFHRLKRGSSDKKIQIVSDYGITRAISSPVELGGRLVLPLEAACRKQGVAQDVRLQPSGILAIVTIKRSLVLRKAGKLPCPHCCKWCLGSKGLWWHQQQNHQVDHAEAATVAAASTDTLAIVPYNPEFQRSLFSTVDRAPNGTLRSVPINTDDPLEFVKNGDLAGLCQAVKNGYAPATVRDAKGSSPILWAAGGGFLELVRYLVDECQCDPSQTQRAKRSFGGRTPLHWAARNGHLPVVQYLTEECQVNVDAATTDGTTALGWASWQGQLPVMKFLVEHGADIHSTNGFGCNAALWCSQGSSNVEIMEWLQTQGCKMTQVNHNRHGVLHKAAQRGQADVCKWFYQKWILVDDPLPPQNSPELCLFGPDEEQCCPSDLAGMEGHADLAKDLAQLEMKAIQRLSRKQELDCDVSLPDWLTKDGHDMRPLSEKEMYLWEAKSGIRRMQCSFYQSRK
eukprot:Nitzschia sp. Nitz4//scaffold195_size40117//17062//18636//NITZ4_007576-RA/size40117-processed-gene-0.14-mRNA-1//1//CDS//3329540365//1812//frame0